MLSDTRPSVLERLREAEEPMVWEDFFERYWPTVFAFARRRGCSEDTADEIVQDVMLKVFRQRDVFQYDRKRGRFRDWLGTLVKNQIAEWRRRPAQRIRPVGGEDRRLEPLNEGPAESPEKAWIETFEHSLLLVLLDLVRREMNPRHYLAFELSGLQDMKARDVAQVTGLSRHAVYKIRKKVLARLQQLAGNYANDGSLTLQVKRAMQLQPPPVVQRHVTCSVSAVMRSGPKESEP
jgi:RNA polymerase sigma-70 factor (ECF subfamily)